MSDTKELTTNQLLKIENQLIRLAILYRTSAKIAKSISQDKELLIMLMKKNKMQIAYGKSQYPATLSKINGVYKVYSDISEMSVNDEVYFNTPHGYLESKINVYNNCFTEEELDSFFHEFCAVFPELTGTQALDLYSAQVDKYCAYPYEK